MKRLIIPVIILLGLGACAAPPRKPAVNLPEVPAGGLVQALEQRRQEFSGLKALARVDLLRKGRRRAFDTVGVLLQSQNKFRLEAYGPLGQSLLVLVWDGEEVLYRSAGETGIQRPGQFGLERALGIRQVDDLCAALSGNIPELEQPVEAKAFCGQDGTCMLEFRKDDVFRRVWVAPPRPGTGNRIKVTAYEVYRSRDLLFRAKFEQIGAISGYLLPGKIIFENPSKNVILTVEYNDVDLNVPIEDSLFTLSGEGTDSP